MLRLPLDTRLLNAFLAVAETGSFTGAARALHCVQSNVTQHVRALERELGASLFERSRRGAVLTPAGEALIAHARAAAARLDQAVAAVRDAAGLAAPLRLGAMETTAAVRLPPLLAMLHQRCPDAPLSLATGTTDELIAAVSAGDIDVGFVAGCPDGRTGLASVEAFRERMVLVGPRGRTAGAAGAPLLAFRQGCAYRALAEQWLRMTGRAPVKIVEMGTLDGILACVASGLGIAILPDRAVRASAHASALAPTPLPDPLHEVRTYAIRRAEAAMTAPLATLMDALDAIGDRS